MMTIEQLARKAYEAYSQQAGGKTHDGKPMPAYKELGQRVQANWIAAVQAVVFLVKDIH